MKVLAVVVFGGSDDEISAARLARVNIDCVDWFGVIPHRRELSTFDGFALFNMWA